MMGGNPNNNWWNMNHHHHSYVLGSSIPFNSLTENPPPPTTNPSSWSQLLFSGVPGEEERLGFDHFQANKKLGSWDEQILNDHDHEEHDVVDIGIIKQEVSSQSGNLYGHHGGNSTTEEFLQATSSSSSGSANWSHMVAMAVSSSPSSCVTTLSNNNNTNNILDFTYNKPDHHHHRKINNQPPADHTSSECNSTSNGGVCKKARVHSSSSQPLLKVRKEKLGDRITALHQLVSPFGKTDTASVLLEAIGYIRFLQAQIQALSSPYLGNSSRNRRNHQSVTVKEEKKVIQVIIDYIYIYINIFMMIKINNIQDVAEEKAKDLRSRGLCLVPMSFTQHVGSENGADYWSSAYATGF
ncbi:transcription factor bHLH68-like [Senna tora]|uniref:Transcription factor bHLH68-like n=1 Tax=Senna tora TaxID=362788 RepID=A0A834XHK3_9FABA|nr:transcription factor bHLH68-like [Senna tora]